MKNYLSEFIGTSFLLMIVVGSGIMGQNLSNDNSIILLANTVATGSGLIILIWMMGPISGAHFNPCLLYTSPSPRDSDQSRMPSSA